MKLWLDDRRPAPDGWILCRWPSEVIAHMEAGGVEEISLDHDLDDPWVKNQGYCSSVSERTGYDVLLWIEEQVFVNGFNPPEIKIHTANSSARLKMEMAASKIAEMRERIEDIRQYPSDKTGKSCPSCKGGRTGIDALCDDCWKEYLGTHCGGRCDEG